MKQTLVTAFIVEFFSFLNELFNKPWICELFAEAIPISYVVPVTSIPIGSSGVLNHGANSPRAADGRSVTSEDTRSDSGKSEEDGELYDATSPALPENTVPASHQIIRVRYTVASTLSPKVYSHLVIK